MVHYWLKQCPRCRGDLRDESDIYGRYVDCVQCGYILKEEEEALLAAGALREPVAAEKVAA